MPKSNCTEIETKGIRKLVNEYVAADVLDRNVQTLRNERHKGIGAPYVKFNRSVRYDLADLYAYIDRHRVRPGSKKAKK